MLGVAEEIKVAAGPASPAAAKAWAAGTVQVGAVASRATSCCAWRAVGVREPAAVVAKAGVDDMARSEERSRRWRQREAELLSQNRYGAP